MKKKFAIGIIGILIVISIIFIVVNFKIKNEKIEDAEVIIGNSEIYSKDEIQSAIDIVLKEFKDFPATLEKLWYDEEKSKNISEKWAKQYNADEAIVLYSNFKTYSEEQAAGGGFNSNFEYKNWSWILVRTNNGEWQLKTWGY